MNTASPAKIKRLPLHSKHVQCGAKFGQFGDWEVPLYYTSILEEHEAVRERAGLFDISHMGEFLIQGPQAAGFLHGVLPRKVAEMREGKALYMPLLNDAGGIVDDIILYKLAADRFLMIVNAANIEKDWKWLEQSAQWWKEQRQKQFEYINQSDGKGLLALQGPLSASVMERALRLPAGKLPYYNCLQWRSGMIARTGYTGEDGFEVMVDHGDLPEVWNAIFEAGKNEGLVPAGFGARDTLRLEAGMLLYGHDMDDEVTPMEAGIAWAVDLEKGSFRGAEKLVEQRQGIQRRLTGFEMIERGIPRQGYAIMKQEKLLGHVTSGGFAPTLKKNIGLGYMDARESVAGNGIDIVIRDKRVQAKIVKLPFYKRNQ